MLRTTSLTLLLLCLVLFHGACCCRPAQEQSYAPGQILVKFNQGVSQKETLAIHGRLGSTILAHYQELNTDLVKLKNGLTVEEAVRLYREDPHVSDAEPNYIRRIQPKKRGDTP